MSFVALKRRRSYASVGNIRDRPLKPRRIRISIRCRLVKKVRWQLRALYADVPSQSEAVINVGSEKERVINAELHA